VTRKLTLIKGFAAIGAAGLLLAGCGDGAPTPGGNNGGDSTESSGSGSYSVMVDWEGCEAFDDIQSLQDYMGVVDLGTSGLVTSKIGSGLDGEAFSCGAMASLASYTYEGSATGERDFPGSANLTVAAAPWDSEDEATENFQGRLDQLADSIETGGLDYTNQKEGELGGDWDESYFFAADTEVGYQINAIGRKGDLIVYTFLDYTFDPALQFDADPVYPFTNEELVDWITNDYMTQTQSDLLAKKESGL